MKGVKQTIQFKVFFDKAPGFIVLCQPKTERRKKEYNKTDQHRQFFVHLSNQNLQTLKNKTTAVKYFFKGFSQTSIPPLISIPSARTSTNFH